MALSVWIGVLSICFLCGNLKRALRAFSIIPSL
nr:MAG TPA: RNA polymerase I specific initiation factor [Caudoviricetes sp.]